jgi:hypothetical protein
MLDYLHKLADRFLTFQFADFSDDDCCYNVSISPVPEVQFRWWNIAR